MKHNHSIRPFTVMVNFFDRDTKEVALVESVKLGPTSEEEALKVARRRMAMMPKFDACFQIKPGRRRNG